MWSSRYPEPFSNAPLRTEMQIYDTGSKSLLREAVRGYLWSRIDYRDRDHVVDTFLGQGRFSEYETSIGYRNVAYFHKRHEALQ